MGEGQCTPRENPGYTPMSGKKGRKGPPPRLTLVWARMLNPALQLSRPMHIYQQYLVDLLIRV